MKALDNYEDANEEGGEEVQKEDGEDGDDLDEDGEN